MSKEKEFNPLDGWTKDQVKSALKANTKTSLLKAAMQWRIMAENLQIEINKLKESKDGE
jgi:hypothetical protein|tara:strand:+ start:402 stop:578 length:177 start_codon:yes stop_codon:yes gene_type:complete